LPIHLILLNMGNRAPAEILQVVFTHIVEPEGCPLVPSGRFVSTELQARRTLVACTTVCRAWREPAQAALYRRLYLGKLSDRDVRHLIETLNAREDLGKQVLSLVIRATGPGQPTTNSVGELCSLLPMIRYITLDTSLALIGQFDKNCMAQLKVLFQSSRLIGYFEVEAVIKHTSHYVSWECYIECKADSWAKNITYRS
jgi:hypothetical protein